MPIAETVDIPVDIAVDITVVIPTYNSGPKIDALLTSLSAQTLPADRFEICVVDDGSTDDTWQRLTGHAETVPNLRVTQIPNSGWPGRPRNVGTDLATGRWVLYVDHDDELFPEALEAMVGFGDSAEADVVIGKEVRSGALGIGSELFQADLPRADLFDDHVLALITPHKAFRTAFLREHGIRFREGRRRLEDHVFLAEVYTRTDRIAVLSSVPCYRWIIYSDGSNNSSSLGDLNVYFGSLADVFDVLEGEWVAPELRRRLLQHWYATRMLGWTYGWWFDSWDDAYQREAVSVISRLAAERVPAQLDKKLPPILARRAGPLRNSDIDTLRELAKCDHQVALRLDAQDLTWTEEGLSVAFSGVLVDRDDQHLTLTEHGGGLFLPLDDDHAFDVRPFLAEARVEFFVKRRDVGTEWYLDHSVPLVPQRTEEGTVLTAQGAFVVDPTTAAFGRPLEPGRWSVFTHTRALGYQHRVRVRGTASGGAVLDDLPAHTRSDSKGRVVLVVGPHPGFLEAVTGEVLVSRHGGSCEVSAQLPGLVLRGDPELLGLRLNGRLAATQLQPGAPPTLTAKMPARPGEQRIEIEVGGRAVKPLATVRPLRRWQPTARPADEPASWTDR